MYQILAMYAVLAIGSTLASAPAVGQKQVKPDYKPKLAYGRVESRNLASMAKGALEGMIEGARVSNASAGEAQAAVQNIYSIDQFYQLCKKINDPKLPESTKIIGYNSLGWAKVVEVPGEAKPLTWTRDGEFSSEFFGSQYGSKMREVMVKYGINIGQFESLLKKVGKESGVSIYQSGHVLVTDKLDNQIYVFKADPNINLAIGRNVYGMKM